MRKEALGADSVTFKDAADAMIAEVGISKVIDGMDRRQPAKKNDAKAIGK